MSCGRYEGHGYPVACVCMRVVGAQCPNNLEFILALCYTRLSVIRIHAQDMCIVLCMRTMNVLQSTCGVCGDMLCVAYVEILFILSTWVIFVH